MALFAAGVTGGVLGGFVGGAEGELVGTLTGVLAAGGLLALPPGGADAGVEACWLVPDPPHALNRNVSVATETAARRQLRSIEPPVR
ncbi:MAG TPA: hypothetical protein VGO18_17665 [Steroidobacteraceae bacterium]|nr:hypothetical protein [Steroidobacteraceae bacterium]